MPVVSGGGGGSGITQAYVGYNTVGGTTDAIGLNLAKQVWKSITLATGCVLVSIDVYVKGNGANVSGLFAGVRADNAGAPGNLIATHSGETNAGAPLFSIAMSATARWVSLPCGIYVASGTYWIGANALSNITLHYDAGGSDQTSTDANTWLNEAVAVANSSRQYSLRANTIR